MKATPPAAALERCADMPALADDKADTLAVWAGDMIDRYTDCAQKHDVLRKWHK